MGKAEFEENSLNRILGASKTIAETITESAGVLIGLYEEAECEFSSVREELRRTIQMVQSKLFYMQQARSDCSKQIEACEQSRIQSESEDEAEPQTSEPQESETQKQELLKQEQQKREQLNAKIEGKIEALQQAGNEMDKYISILEKNLETVCRLEKELLSAKSRFDSGRAGNTVKLQRAVSNGNRFYLAVELAHTKAMEIAKFRDSALPVHLHGNTFKIDPMGHEGFIERNHRASRDLTDTGVVSAERGADDDIAALPSSITMILEDTTAEQFLSRVDASEEACITVKAPSYNLHKLGGIKIIKEMESRGFQIKRDGGSMIGNDGYITWEKRR